MNKYTRNQRIATITKILIENPNKIINFSLFSELFDAAKSTISEDIDIIKTSFSALSQGNIETISGAAGGVKYVCGMTSEENFKFAEELCNILRNKGRIIPGEFLYMTDIMYNPEIVHKAAVILASVFMEKNADYVVTVETKGVPLAFEVARLLGVQLVIVRRENKVTEGSTVTINYVSASSKRIQNMCLSKKSIRPGSKLVFIDDFMKGGGTSNGIYELLNEFESKLVGIGVLMDNIGFKDKLVNEYYSVIDFNGIDESGYPVLSPACTLKKGNKA